jgi:hypothetical protein
MQRRSSRLPLQSGMQLSALNAPQPTADVVSYDEFGADILREESSSRAHVKLSRCSIVLMRPIIASKPLSHAVVILCGSVVVAATPWL